MSKSRGNVVGPDDYVNAHGSDVLRCALLFTCPWEVGGDFHDDSIAGIERFFTRVWKTVAVPATEKDSINPLVERTILAVSDAIEKLSFNVGLARLMEFAPAATTARDKRVLVQLLAPFAPHLAEELWARLGETFSVHTSAWPTANLGILNSEPIPIVVQVDGRVRARIEVDPTATEAQVVDAAVGAVNAIEPFRVVYVPGRLVNLVT